LFCQTTVNYYVPAMKQLLIVFFLMTFSFLGFGQSGNEGKTIIENGVPQTEVTVKRCYAKGNTVYVDLIIENYSGKDMNLRLRGTLVTDDEGISYGKANIYHVNRDGERVRDDVDIFIPKEGFARFQTQLADISEYASSLQYMNIWVRTFTSGDCEIIVRKLPIDRN